MLKGFFGKQYKNCFLNFTRFFIFLSFLFLFIGCEKKDTTAQVSFSDFANDIFLNHVKADTISLHYMIASPKDFGIESFTPTLGSYGSEQMEESILNSKNLLKALDSYNYNDLTKEEQLIYDSLKLSLQFDVSDINNIYFQESLGPTTGLQAQLPILLAEYTFYQKSDIDDYLCILENMDDYFAQIILFEEEKSKKGYFMNDEVADSIINQCASFIEFPEKNLLIECFNDKLASFDELNQRERTLYQEKNREAVLTSVIPAYQNLIDSLSRLKGSSKNQKGLCGFKNGKEYYEALVQLGTGSSKTVKEMKKLLTDSLKSCMTSIRSIQLTDPNVMKELITFSFPYQDPIEIMEYLKTAVKDDFPLLEDVNYSVKYVHPSLENYLSPAMYLIPPLDNFNNNNIYINKKPGNDLSHIFPTIAHEGYPGHLYQNVYFHQQNPAPIRRLLSPTGYEEGWATYVELYSYGLAGFSKSLTTLLACNTLATHCLYSLTDIGINYDGWTKTDTISFLEPFGIEEETAKEIFLNMVAEPGIYLPYSIGCLEFLELRQKAIIELKDKFTLKEFHTFLMDLGPAPFSIVENEMTGWMESLRK